MDFKSILESWQEKNFQLSILDSRCSEVTLQNLDIACNSTGFPI